MKGGSLEPDAWNVRRANFIFKTNAREVEREE